MNYGKIVGKELFSHLMNANWKSIRQVKYNDTIIELKLWDKIAEIPIDSQHIKLVFLINGKNRTEITVELEKEYYYEWGNGMYCIKSK